MYTVSDIKVKLLNKDEVKDFIKNHGEVASVCYNSDKKYADKIGLKCMESGHFSGCRGDYFKFEIECPRFTADQIVRHEIGVFKNMQSQRYVDEENIDIYCPAHLFNDDIARYKIKQFEITTSIYYKDIKNECKKLGYEDEKANDLVRGMLPIGVKTKLVVGFTLEALINFMNKRLCSRADLPIRTVARLMRELIIDIEPRYEKLLVPQCEANLFCTEDKSCGRVPKKEDLEKIYKDYYNSIKKE